MSSHLFILGAGRSGTKIFRDCLGSSNDATAIPYDVGYVWRYGNERLAHDELKPEQAAPEIASFVGHALHRMARRAGGRGGDGQGVLVEKSVPNVLRPAFVAKLFPQGRLVHIVRNGYDVIESTMRNWRHPEDRGYMLDKLRYFPPRNYRYAMWALTNRARAKLDPDAIRLWGPRYEGMESDARTLSPLHLCTKQWVECVETCERQLGSLAAASVLRVRYEDLLSDESVLNEVCAFAGIGDVGSVIDFYQRNFDPARAGSAASGLTAEQRREIRALAGLTLDRFGHV